MLMHLLLSLGATLVLIALAIGLGAAVKAKTLRSGHTTIALLSSAIFATDLYFALRLAFDHHNFWWFTILFYFVGLVFYLGTMLVCNQGLRFENGGVILKKGGLLYRMIYVKPMGMRKRQDLTLCSISWLGALVIVFYPTLYLLGHIVCFALAAVGFVIFAQDPTRQNRWWHEYATEDSCYERFWVTLYLGPMPFSPVLLLAMTSCLGGGIWLMTFLPWVSWWIVLQLLLLLVIGAVLLWPLCYLAAFLMDRADQKRMGRRLLDYEQRTERVTAAPRAVGTVVAFPFCLLANGIAAAFEPLVSLWGVLKKNACPKIIIRD